MPILADTSSSEPVEARFDWYAATILEYPQRLLEVLSARLHGHIIDATPRNGYESASQIVAGKRVLATVLYGGAFEFPHAFASSDETDAFVAVVRDVWPNDHRVTRMDCALDFDEGDETFARLFKLCSDLADGERVEGDNRKRAAKVRVRNVGDWHREIDGRTFYLGSPKSAVQVRLYEKGILILQEAEMLRAPREDVSRNLVRLEVQVRPDGPARARAAKCSPADAFGYSDWSRELYRRVSEEQVERVHIRERRLSNHERAMRWVSHQYRDHFIQAAELAGGWEQLGAALGDRIMKGKHGELPDTPKPEQGEWRGWEADDDERPF